MLNFAGSALLRIQAHPLKFPLSCCGVRNMLKRRMFLQSTLATLLLASQNAASQSKAAQPVILDTDIGDDIDDTWALLMLLREPQLDLRLVVGDYGNPFYRARLIARLLEELGHSKVAIGLGLSLDEQGLDRPGQQSAWLANYQMASYPGTFYEDGVQAIIETIKNSPDPVTLVCLGPAPNIAEALRRDVSISENARFVGMYGSIRRGYGQDPTPSAEYNVRVDPDSLRAIFAATWDCAIAPLDTCGDIVLDGKEYEELYRSKHQWAKILMANYKAWLPGAPFISPDHDMSKQSTTLFDTVAVHLATGGEFLSTKTLPLRVTDDGYTMIDDSEGRPVQCALEWKDQQAFKRLLVERLLT